MIPRICECEWRCAGLAWNWGEASNVHYGQTFSRKGPERLQLTDCPNIQQQKSYIRNNCVLVAATAKRRRKVNLHFTPVPPPKKQTKTQGMFHAGPSKKYIYIHIYHPRRFTRCGTAPSMTSRTRVNCKTCMFVPLFDATELAPHSTNHSSNGNRPGK